MGKMRFPRFSEHGDFAMTLSQRLTRAGLVFILFGSVVAVLPTNGSATAATKYKNSKAYTLGTAPGDLSTTYAIKSSAPGPGTSVTLKTFIDSTPVSNATLTFTKTPGSGSGTFANTQNADGSVTITATGPATETVSAAFPGGTVVDVTVIAT